MVYIVGTGDGIYSSPTIYTGDGIILRYSRAEA